MRQVGVVGLAGRAAGVLVLLLVVSCGSDGGGDLPRPTFSPTRTPTASLPTPTRSPDLPTPTLPSPDLPTPTLPSPDLPTPTRSPDRTSSPEEPVTEPTRTTAAATSTPEATTREPRPATTAPTAPASEDSDERADEPAAGQPEDDGVPTWAWWLLGVLLVAVVVAVLLVLRARRRRTWRQEVDEAEGELAWLARDLLPRLRQSGSREQLAGGWVVSRARVEAAEDRLTVLESSAPGEADAQRARSLRDAVRAARGRMEQLAGPEPVDDWTREVDAVIADLETTLRPEPDPPPPSRQ